MNSSTSFRFVTIGGIATALAGSVWAVVSQHTCDACHAASQLLGFSGLGWLGILVYIALLVVAFRYADHKYFTFLLLTASGIHAALLLFLYHNGIACPPCILTALGAFAATGATASLSRPSRETALGILCSVFILTFGGAWGLQANARVDARAVLAQFSGEKDSLKEGIAQLIVFTRNNCTYRETFENEIRPMLQERYGSRLVVSSRKADDYMPTPTLVVLGDGKERVFVGLAQQDALDEMIFDIVKQKRDQNAINALKEKKGSWERWYDAYPGADLILVGGDLREEKLYGATIVGEVRLAHAQMEGANLSSVTFSGTNLDCANLDKAYFLDANLQEVSLVSASLEDAVLAAEEINNTDFRYANMSGARFRSPAPTFLNRPKFSRAQLYGADLSKCTTLNEIDWGDGVYYDWSTKWPEGFPKPKNLSWNTTRTFVYGMIFLVLLLNFFYSTYKLATTRNGHSRETGDQDSATFKTRSKSLQWYESMQSVALVAALAAFCAGLLVVPISMYFHAYNFTAGSLPNASGMPSQMALLLQTLTGQSLPIFALAISILGLHNHYRSKVLEHSPDGKTTT